MTIKLFFKLMYTIFINKYILLLIKVYTMKVLRKDGVLQIFQEVN
jgi:hypothetical protein